MAYLLTDVGGRLTARSDADLRLTAFAQWLPPGRRIAILAASRAAPCGAAAAERQAQLDVIDLDSADSGRREVLR